MCDQLSDLRAHAPIVDHVWIVEGQRPRASRIALEVAQVMNHIGAAVRVDVDRAGGRQDHGVKPLGCPIDLRRGGAIVEALSGVGFDLGKFRSQRWRHHSGFDDSKATEGAIRKRQMEDHVGGCSAWGALPGVMSST